MPRVFTERSEVPLVTLNLCVMRRYNLGEGHLVSTSPLSFLRRATARLKCKGVDAKVGRSPWQVLSGVVVVWRTHRGEVGASGLHGTE